MTQIFITFKAKCSTTTLTTTLSNRVKVGDKNLSAINQMILHPFVSHHVRLIIWTLHQCFWISHGEIRHLCYNTQHSNN